MAVLLNNIPSQTEPITLTEEEIATLAEEYLKGILKRFRWWVVVFTEDLRDALRH